MALGKKPAEGFAEKATVYAASALPGVPEGTKGKVLMAYGLSWRRYRVDFDNGVHLGQLDGKYLRATP